MKVKSALLLLSAILTGHELLAELPPRQVNPTAEHLRDKFKFVSGDLTDTDGDGMTDVGELKYGFDPNDANSFPSVEYYLDENSTFEEPAVQEVFGENNRFYYYFTNTPKDLEDKFRKLFIKLMPIMYDKLGPPMETIVCEIRCMPGSGAWFSSQRGRLIKIRESFLHRVMIHEMIHSWKGQYLLASRPDSDYWSYDTAMSGFEEGITEGYANEIVREYVRTYPTEEEVEDLLWSGPWYYSPEMAVNYDMMRHLSAAAGGFPFSYEGWLWRHRYSVGAITSQILITKRPTFYKDLMKIFSERIKRHPKYRPSVNETISIYRQLVGRINGIPTRKYLEKIPFFQGKHVEGFHPIYYSRPYGNWGKAYYSLGFAYKRKFWWSSVHQNDYERGRIPNWVPSKEQSRYGLKADFQEQPGKIDVYNVHNELVSTHQVVTPREEDENGDMKKYPIATSEDLQFEKFPIGLYRKQIEWTNFVQHTDKAVHEVHFFGYEDYSQNKEEEIAFFVGVDADIEGQVRVNIEDVQYTHALVNGCAVFKSTTWPLDFQGDVLIYVTAGGVTNGYERTILDATTYSGYHQTQFVIIDRDFDGIEDPYDDEVVPIKIEGDYVDVTYEKTPEGLVIRWPDDRDDNVSLYLNLVHGDDVLYWGGHGTADASVNYEKFGLTGAEKLDMWFVEYHNREYSKTYSAVRINLNDFADVKLPNQKIDLGQISGGFASADAIPSPHAFHAKFDGDSEDLVGISRVNPMEYDFTRMEIVSLRGVLDEQFYGTEEGLVEVDIEANNEAIREDSSITDLLDSLLKKTLSPDDPENVVLIERGKRDTISANIYDNNLLSDSDMDETELALVAKLKQSLAETNDADENEERASAITNQSVYENVSDNSTSTDHSAKVADLVTRDVDWGSLERLKSVYTSSSEPIPTHYPGVDLPTTPENPPTEEPEVNEWASAEVYGAGWRHVEWFGYYWESESLGWIFKPCGGWFYLSSVSYDSVWLWSQTLNEWVWTSKDVYPYIYSVSRGWVYFNEDEHCIYDYVEERWILLEDIN